MITSDIQKAISSGVKIGKETTIVGSTDFGSEPYLIQIGDNVCISFGVSFITHDNATKVINNILNDKTFAIYKPIKIGNNCFIGAKSIILPGVTIGNNVIIGAGSVVTKNIEDNTVAAGVPCKKISSIDEYIEKNKSDFLYIRTLPEEERKQYLINYFNLI